MNQPDQSLLSSRQALTGLYFLRQVRPGVKINTIGRSFDEPGWASAFRRTLQGQDRSHSVRMVEDIVAQALPHLASEGCPGVKKALLAALEDSREGLANLMKTYEADPTTVARLKFIVTTVNMAIAKAKSELQGDRLSSPTD